MINYKYLILEYRSMSEITIGKKMMAEAIGTFILVFIGAGSVVASNYFVMANSAFPQLLLIAFANGLALAVAITIAMGISGGHINPAVTIGFLTAKLINARDALLYIISQVIGATLAGLFLLFLLPVTFSLPVHLGTPSLASGVSVLQGISIEAVITFFLVLAVFGTIVDRRAPRIGGFGVGLVLAASAMVAGPFTGAAANPARAIGPALASGFLQNWYVYWIGPIVGGIVAALVYNYLFREGVEKPSKKRR